MLVEQVTMRTLSVYEPEMLAILNDPETMEFLMGEVMDIEVEMDDALYQGTLFVLLDDETVAGLCSLDDGAVVWAMDSDYIGKGYAIEMIAEAMRMANVSDVGFSVHGSNERGMAFANKYAEQEALDGRYVNFTMALADIKDNPAPKEKRHTARPNNDDYRYDEYEGVLETSCDGSQFVGELNFDHPL